MIKGDLTIRKMTEISGPWKIFNPGLLDYWRNIMQNDQWTKYSFWAKKYFVHALRMHKTFFFTCSKVLARKNSEFRSTCEKKILRYLSAWYYSIATWEWNILYLKTNILFLGRSAHKCSNNKIIWIFDQIPCSILTLRVALNLENFPSWHFKFWIVMSFPIE